MLSGLKLGGHSTDLSVELTDLNEWNIAAFKTLEHLLDIVAVAIEPVLGLFAVGTSSGAIHVYGAPGVDSTLLLPDPNPVKFIQFALSASKLVCVDATNRLYVWDLSAEGRPKLQTNTKLRHGINALMTSPLHTHAFLALDTGEVKTFDLLCLRISQYSIPDMWTAHLKKMAASGFDAPPAQDNDVALDIVAHPRDLNLVFVVYGGGVALGNLTDCSCVRAYQYVVPPGAPGGNGYNQLDLMTHRYPSVTAFAIHPTGHFFAVGHDDGSIAFWATQDEDKPLLVRTLDEIDVNIVDGTKLPDSTPHVDAPPPGREPIFKLAWSGFPNSPDPRGAETVLTVLGGLNSTDETGVNAIQFPPFNPPEPAGASAGGLHPAFRKAMHDSLSPANVHFYPSAAAGAPVQDFVLVPRQSPHFGGTWDPKAVLVVSEAQGGTRTIEAHDFPPPDFASTTVAAATTGPVAPATEDASGDVMDELSSTLESMKVSVEPLRLTLPPFCWSGPSGVTSGSLVKVERDNYKNLTDGLGAPVTDLMFSGGAAWVDSTEDHSTELRLVHYQPHRIIVTVHKGLTVRFRDISTQLLATSSLGIDYPNPLPWLTIDLLPVLGDPAVANVDPSFLRGTANIFGAELCSEASHCAVALESGQVLLYRLGHGPLAETSGGHVHGSLDKELISLQHIGKAGGGRGWYPDFMLAPGRGPISAYSLSDYGFLAVAYQDGSLFVVHDYNRQPWVMYRELPETKSKRHSSLFHHASNNAPAISLTWTVCGLASDPDFHIRLIAASDSGSALVYTVAPSARTPSGLEMHGSPQSAESAPQPFARSFVLESKTGRRCRLDRRGVGLTQSAGLSGKPERKPVLWVSAGAKGARAVLDVTGDRVGKAEWPSAAKVGAVQCAQVVERSDAFALVALTDQGKALVYSLPGLDLLHTLQLPNASSIPPSLDESGDFVLWHQHLNARLIFRATYGTLFNTRRFPADARVQVALAADASARAVPPQPQPIPLGPQGVLGAVGSWLGVATQRSLTGEQVDALLAGPDRPIPQALPPKPQLKDFTQWTSEDGRKTGGTTSPGLLGQVQDTSNSLYERLGAAVSERGEALGALQEHTDSLQRGTANMLNQAKRLAAQQTAKGWFSGL